MKWEGVAFSEIAKLAKPKPEAKFVMEHSYGGCTTNVPLEELYDDDVLIAYNPKKQKRTQRRRDAKLLQRFFFAFVNIKSFHLTYESTKEELAIGRQEFEAAGLQIVGGYVLNALNSARQIVRNILQKFFGVFWRGYENANCCSAKSSGSSHER